MKDIQNNEANHITSPSLLTVGDRGVGLRGGLLFLSDFDGTLTTTDSMFRIIIFHRGWTWFLLTMLLLSPIILLMFMGIVSNHRTKEILLGRCFGGMTEDEFCQMCQRFADTHRTILRKELYEDLLREQQNGNNVVVITASPEHWVSRLVPDFTVLGTKLQFTDKGFTGHFLTPNCYGQEKVNRLLQAYPDIKDNRQDYHITAFGDSRGDKELLAYADIAVMIKK